MLVGKCILSAPSHDKLEALINEYYCSTNYRIDGNLVINSKTSLWILQFLHRASYVEKRCTLSCQSRREATIPGKPVYRVDAENTASGWNIRCMGYQFRKLRKE